MKYNNPKRKPKSFVFKLLKAKGLTAERCTVNGKRVWLLSDGRKFDTLAELISAFSS